MRQTIRAYCHHWL